MTDIELVQNVKEKHCNQSLKELIQRHSGICTDIFNRYAGKMQSSGIYVNDVFNDKDFIIHKAAITFNDEKSKFVTWVGQMAKFYCKDIMAEKKEHPTVSMADYEMDFYVDHSADFDYNLIDIKDTVAEALNKIEDEKVKTVIYDKYIRNPPLKTKEIAAKLGVSTQWVNILKQKGLKIVKENIKL